MNLIQAMRAFVEIVERGTLAKAAHALKVSSPAISMTISNLEKHVGVSLLTRSTRSVAPTGEGLEYYQLCKRVLADIGSVEASLSPSRTNPHGQLRIDVNYAWARELIMPLLPEYCRRYPDIALEFSNSGHVFGSEQIAADVTLRTSFGELEGSGVIARKIGWTRSICAASPDYLARRGVPARPVDLMKHQCIRYIDAVSGRRWEWLFEQDGKLITIDPPYRLGFTEGRLGVDAALNGMGLVTELYCDIRPYLADGRLVQVLKGWSWITPPIYLMYPKALQRSAAVRSFVDLMLEHYPPGKEIVPPQGRTPGGKQGAARFRRAA